MNRNTTIVLAFIVIGALTVGVIYILPPILDEVFGEKQPMNTLIEFYDKDGNLVGSSVPMAIYASGAEVETMVVKASWTVDVSPEVDPATFNAHIDVYVAVWDEYKGDYEHLDTKSIDSSVIIQESNVEVHTWTLATLLQEYMTEAHKAEGWSLRIRAALTPTAKDFDGVDVVPDPPTQDALVVTAGLTWVDTTASMTIISFEVDRWLPLAP